MRYAALYGDFSCKQCAGVAALRRRARHDRRALRRVRRRLAQARAERDRAVASGRQKDEALAAICHDLRTPLNAILGWAQLARVTSEDGPEAGEAFEAIERNARRQAALIDDILDLARGAGGELRVERRAVDLNELAAAALDAVRPVAAAKGIELRSQTGASPAWVRGDPTHLQRVLWNLLNNAVKFTPAGGRVALDVRSEGPDVRARVSDTGRGVRPEFLPRIFEPFAQDRPGGARTPGVGLGLAIVRQLIESHAGRIEAASDGEGHGASFTVTLPTVQRGSAIVNG